MNIEMNPATDRSWDGQGNTKVLLVAVNKAGYYSVPVRLLSLICAESDRLRKRFDTRYTEQVAGAVWDGFIDRVAAWSPSIIGFSVNIWNRDEVFSLIPELKARIQGLCILAGGQEVTGSCVDYMRMVPELDYIVEGEGEIPFQQFLDDWDEVRHRLRNPENVSGLRFRENGLSRLTRPADYVASLDDLPSPVLAGLVPIGENQKLGVLLEGTRGCPFHCAFCFEGAKKAKVRSASVQRLAAEIDCVIPQGASYFHIMDPVLCIGDSERLEQLTGHIKALAESGRTATFSVETYAEHISGRVAHCLKACSIIDVGLQTIHEPSLKAIHRRYVPEAFQAGLQNLRDASASFNLYLICGLPYETLASYLRGVKFVIENKPTRFFLNELCLLNGTELRRRADEYGYRFDPTPPYHVLETAWLSPFELKMAQSASKVVERRHNLSASGLFVRYHWLPEKQIDSPGKFSLSAPGGCSFGCDNCQSGQVETKSEEQIGDWDKFLGADVDLSAGDSADRIEILRLAGKLRLSGAARVRLTAPASLFNDLDYIEQLLGNGIWSFRTFIGFQGDGVSPAHPPLQTDAADVHAAVSNVCRSVQLKGRGVIWPFLEIVVRTAGLSTEELDNHIAAFAAQNVPLVTVVPDAAKSSEDRHHEMANLFKNRISLRTWLRMPETIIGKVLGEIQQPEEVLDHLRWMDLVYRTAPLYPPCHA